MRHPSAFRRYVPEAFEPIAAPDPLRNVPLILCLIVAACIAVSICIGL